MFFKRIFKRPLPPEPLVEKLSLDAFLERVKKVRGERLENSKPKLNAMFGVMFKEREVLLNELKTLANAEPAEVLHPALLKTATEAKKLLIDKMTRALLDIGSPPEISINALAAFDGRLTKIINLTNDAMILHGRYVQTAFGKLAAVQSHLRELHERFRQAHAIIEETLRESDALNSLHLEIESQKALIQNAEKTRADVESLQRRVTEIEGKLKDEKNALTQLLSSEEFKRAADSRQKLENVESEINHMKSEVVSAFSDISRPLRKLGKLVTSGEHQMDREVIKTLELCLNDPVEVLSSDEKIASAQSLLRQTTKLLSEGKIEFDKDERRKKLERTEKLAVELGEFKRRLEILNRQLEALGREAEHPVQKQVTELKQAIHQREGELTQVKTLIDDLSKKSTQLEEEIKDKRVKLEKLASEALGTKIELTS